MNRIKIIKIAALFMTAAIISVGLFTVNAYNSSTKAVHTPKTPQRIVSLVPGNTEILFALGLGDKIVGVTRYCNYPAAAKAKSKVGDMNASAERIISLNPDMVLAHAFLNDNLTKRLRSLGIQVMSFDPKTFAETYSDIRTVGKATGRTKEADAVVKRMSAQVASVKSKTVRTKSKKVMVVIQPNPLWVAGPKSLVDEMLRYSNASNIANDAKPGYNQFSTEVAIARNPDVIIVTRKQERDFIINSPIWKRTAAVKSKHIYVVDGDLLLRAGPRISDGLSKLAAAIHPEAFR